MIELPFRFRRLRRSEGLRRLVRENALATDDLILPIFVLAVTAGNRRCGRKTICSFAAPASGR